MHDISKRELVDILLTGNESGPTPAVDYSLPYGYLDTELRAGYDPRAFVVWQYTKERSMHGAPVNLAELAVQRLLKNGYNLKELLTKRARNRE